MSGTGATRLAYRWALGKSLVVGSIWLASGCSGSYEPAQRSPEVKHPLAVAIKPTANVPSLLGEPIDGLRRRLGAPQQLPGLFSDSQQYADLAPRRTDSLMIFRTGGMVMIASYNIRTRAVHDLLLLGHHEDSLMQRSSLRADAENYLIIPVFQLTRPGRLLGLRIVPITER